MCTCTLKIKNFSMNRPPGNSRKPSRKYSETGYGKTLIYYRTRLELTQEELADITGLPSNRISAIESGETRRPQRDTIRSIVIGLNALGLEIDEDEFDRQVREYNRELDSNVQVKATADNGFTGKIELSEEINPDELAFVETLVPKAKEEIGNIQLNSAGQFIIGISLTLSRYEKVRQQKTPLRIEEFAALVNQLDRFNRTAKTNGFDKFFPSNSPVVLCAKISKFLEGLGISINTDKTLDYIANDLLDEQSPHVTILKSLINEITAQIDYLENRNDTIFSQEIRQELILLLELLLQELHQEYLDLKFIDTIRAKLENIDNTILDEVLVLSQVLLGKYASKLAPRSVYRDSRYGPQMVVMPTGEFIMGSPENEEGRYGDGREGPQRSVAIDYRFSVGRYPVTFKEWDIFKGLGGTEHYPDDEGWGRGARPVINITWYEAVSYVGWLSKHTQKSYRLLSSAEWEFSCRAGTETAFFFGDNYLQLDIFSWFKDNSENKTHPVGLKEPNAFGLYDLYGNVNEWVADCSHKNYIGAPVDGSAWEEGKDANSSFRTARGGSWYNGSHNLRSAACYFDPPGLRSIEIGFRVARIL